MYLPVLNMGSREVMGYGWMSYQRAVCDLAKKKKQHSAHSKKHAEVGEKHNFHSIHTVVMGCDTCVKKTPEVKRLPRGWGRSWYHVSPKQRTV